MRAMTEWRRRLRQSGKFEGGKLMLYRHPGGRKLMLGGLKLEAIADVAMPVLHGMNG